MCLPDSIPFFVGSVNRDLFAGGRSILRIVSLQQYKKP